MQLVSVAFGVVVVVVVCVRFIRLFALSIVAKLNGNLKF